MELFKLLESCCADIVEWPPWSALSPGHGVDGDKYAQLLDAVNLLRDVRRYRPSPAGWQSLQPVLVERFEEEGTCFVSAERNYMRTLARRSGGGRPRLGKSGAGRLSRAKGQKNASVVSKHASAQPGLHMTESGDDSGEENKQIAENSQLTVTDDKTEHVVDAGKDDDDVTEDDSATVADDAASDVTIVTSDIDIAEFKLSLDDAAQELKADVADIAGFKLSVDAVEEVKADIADRSPSPDVQHLTLDSSDDKSSSSVQIPPSLPSQREVDEEGSTERRLNDVELEQIGEMSEVVESQLHGSQAAENEAEAARVIGEYNLRSGAQSSGNSYREAEADVNKCVTSLRSTSVSQNMDVDDSSETQSLSGKEDIVTSLDKDVDAGCRDTTLTAAVYSVSMQSLSDCTELTSRLSDEVAATVNVFQPQQTSVNSADESSQKLPNECGREFQTCVADGKDYLESETVVGEHATLLSPTSLSRNMDIDDSDKTRSLSDKEDVVTSLDEATDAGYSSSLLTVAADSVSKQSLSDHPEVQSDFDDEASDTNDASQQQQTSSVNSTNESLQKLSKEAGQELCINDETGIVIGKASETDTADMPISDNLDDGTSAEHLGNVTDGETINFISSGSESMSETAITSHLEQSASREDEEVKTLVSLSKSDPVKLSGDGVDAMMPRCFVRLHRMPSSSAGTDAADPDPSSVTACSELHRKCSVVLQRLSPSSLELSSLSLTKPSASTLPCTDEDRMNVIIISSDEDEDETPADVIELLDDDDKCSSVPQQTSATICMTSSEYIDETVPETMSVTEAEAGDRNIVETQLCERSECAANSDVQDIQLPMTVSENEPQSDKLSGKSERTEVASDIQEMADLETWHPLNYCSYLAEDYIKDINLSPAKELEDDLHLTSVIGGDDMTAADTNLTVTSGHMEDQNTEATESGYSALAYNDDNESREVAVTRISSVDLTSANVESTTVFSATKHELVTEDENAVCGDVIESSVVVVSDDRCSHLCTEEAVAVAAIVNEEAKTLCGDIIDTTTAEKQDLSTLSVVAVDSPAMLDHEESSTTIESEDSLTFCSDVSKMDTVKTTDILSALVPESVTTTSDRCSQLCIEGDVAVATSVNDEAKTLYGKTTDMTAAEARDGDMMSLSAVAVDSSTMVDDEESSTVIDNEDSRTLCSDTVKTTERLSVPPSESLAITSDGQLCTEEDVAFAANVNEEAETLCGGVTDTAIVETQDLSSLSVVAVDSPTMLGHEEGSTVSENEDSSTLCGDVSKTDTVKTTETSSVLPSDSIATTDSVSVVPEGGMDSTGLINSVVSRGATNISADITGALTFRTEYLGNDCVADNWILCDESNNGDNVVVCDPFPIFAERRTHSDSMDNLRQSTMTQNNSEGFEGGGVTDGHTGCYEGESREDVCALIDNADVPEPADEVDLCTTSASVQSSGDGHSEADYDDDINTDSKSCTAGPSPDNEVADIQSTGAAASDLNADLPDDMLSRSNDQPVCLHSATTADSSMCLDPAQLKVDNSAEDIHSDDTKDRGIALLADIEADMVRSELYSLLVTHSSQDNETCRMLKGTQEPMAEEQPVRTENDAAEPVTCEENFDAIKLGDSAHIDPGSCTEDFDSSKQHLLPAHFEDTNTLTDETHKETAAENKRVFFKLDKLSAICKDVHKNVQHGGGESAAGEDPHSVPDKPEHMRSNERPDRALAASTSSPSHTYYCPDCPLMFFSYTAFISHLRTENQGFVSSAASTVTRPGTSLPSAPRSTMSLDSLVKSLNKDNASVSTLRSSKWKVSELQNSDISTGSVETGDRSETAAPVLTQGCVDNIPSQEAQLDSAEHPHPVPVKSRRSLPTSARRTQKQVSVNTATGLVAIPDTSATPMPAKSRRSLPESLDKSTAPASPGKSRKHKNSDSRIGSVGKLQLSSPVLMQGSVENIPSQEAELDSAEHPRRVPVKSRRSLPTSAHRSQKATPDTSATPMPAKSRRSLPESLHKSTTPASAGKSRKHKNSDSPVGSVGKLQLSSPVLTQGSVDNISSQEAQLDSAEHPHPVPVKSRRSLPTSARRSQKRVSVNTATGLVTTPDTSATPMPAKSRRSLPESFHKSTALASAGKSRKRKNSDSRIGSVGKLQVSSPVLTQGSVDNIPSQEAQLDSTEHPHPVPVKSRHSLPTSADRSQKQVSVSTASGLVATPDTSATPMPAKSRLPESVHKSTAPASAGKSCKRKNSAGRIGSVDKLQVSSPVLFAVLSEGSAKSAAVLPTELHTSEPSTMSSAKARRSLPKSRRESNASTSSGRSYNQKKTSDNSTASKTGKQQCQEEGDVASSQPVAAKSHRRLPKASLLTGQPQKQLMSTLDSSDTNVETHQGKQDVEKSSRRVRAKSCCSLPKSDSAPAAVGKSASRKRSASHSTDCNTGNKRMKDDTAKSSQTKTHSADCNTGSKRMKKDRARSSQTKPDSAVCNTGNKSMKEDTAKSSQTKPHSADCNTGSKRIKKDTARSSQTKPDSADADCNTGNKSMKEDTAKSLQTKSRRSLPKSSVCCEDSSTSKPKSRSRRSVPL